MVKSKAVTVTKRKQTPTEPRGIVASITAGFEAVNRQFLLILLPFLLDVWLWLGVHFSIAPLTQRLAAFFTEVMRATPSPNAQEGAQLMNMMLEMAGERINFFSLLSTAPLGLPSLLTSRPNLINPLGMPLTLPISNVIVAFILLILFVIIGVWVGALYFGMVAQQVRDGKLDVVQLLVRVWPDWIRLLIVLGLGLALIFIVGAPALVIVSVISAFSPFAGYLVLVAVGTGLLWVLIFGGFAPHGIVLQRRGLFGGLLDSLRLVQSNLPQTASLFATLMLINLGLNALWRLPVDDSWLLLIGIGGHAIVSTATVAATFVFYQDRYQWWQEMQKSTTTQRSVSR